MQALLQRHAAAGIGRRSADTTRWNDLIDAIDPRLRSDAYWPQLAAHLAQATRTTPDLRQIITTAARQGPLPDELPAAALWWRIAGALSPTATLATTHSRLRPAWITDVDAVFGSVLAETITSDPAWPGLVAAISAADPHKWTPRDLLSVAAEQLADASDDSPPHPARRLRPTDHLHRRRVHPPPTGPSRRGLRRHPHPRGPDARPTPPRKHLLPPDPEDPYPAIDERAALDDYFDVTPPDPHTFEYPARRIRRAAIRRLLSKPPYTRIGHHHGKAHHPARRIPNRLRRNHHTRRRYSRRKWPGHARGRR